LSSPETEKIDKLISQAIASRESSYQTTLKLSEEILKHSFTEDYTKGLAEGHFLKGYSAYKMSNYVSSRYSLVEAISHYTKLNDEVGVARAHNTIGQTYYFEGDFEKSLEHNSSSLAIREKLGDKEGVAHNYNNYSNIYLALGDYPGAIDYYQKALNIFGELNDENSQGMVYNNLGSVYFRLQDNDKALELYKKSVAAAEKFNNKHLLSSTLNNIANVHHIKGELQKSIDVDLKALEIQRQIGDKYGIGLTMGNLGSSYSALDINDKAIDYLTESISIKQTIGDKIGESETGLELGRLYMKLNKHQRAKSFIQASIEIAESLKIYNQLHTCHSTFSALYEKMGDYENSLKHYKLFYEYWQKVFSEESDKKIKNLQIMYEVDKQVKETEIYRLKNIELAQLNIEKNEFLGIAAHDLKNPLTGIILNTSTIKRNIESMSKDDLLKRITKMELTAERMQMIIKNMLDINAIEEGRLNLIYELFDVRILLKKIIEEYKPSAALKEIEIKVIEPDSKITLNTDGNSLTEIVENLLSNAIKYSMHGKTVYVKSSIKENSAVIEITDEGLGFTEEDKKSVFKKFARLSAKPTGGEHSTGLGLSIVKKLTDILGGEISFESEPGKGSTFILKFPLAD